ncbi:MAG: hypothetical protein LLG06_19825 [Desulfobacteraceae bacterium]|nr:hypothetical protein [Desulfobacteraceae bacterium]
MAYTGDTRMVSCARGGLTGVVNTDNIDPFMMIEPTRNLLLEKAGRRKRGGTALLYEAAMTGTPRCLGLFDCTFRNGNQYLVSAWDDGSLYKNGADTIKTGMGTTNAYSMAMGEDKLFVADGVGTPQVWTEATIADVAEPATDWATMPPFQFLLHRRGLSQRMAGLNSTGIYLSASYSSAGDLEKFATGALYIPLDTGDGDGCVGMGEQGKELLLYGKKRTWRLNDESLTTSEWGWEEAQWKGGVGSWRLIIPTPNDTVLMSEDGVIYSVIAVADYGDYKQASLTKDSWIHDWIQANVRLDYISHFHGSYDPTLRAVFIWVVLNGKTTADTALVYFIDRPIAEAWMIHDNSTAASGYTASASASVKLSTGKTGIYTGDYTGNVWKMNQANRNDNSAAYYAGWKTPPDSCENPRSTKLFNALKVMMDPKGNYNLSVKVTVDGAYKKTLTLSMAAGMAVLGTFVLGTDKLQGYSLLEEDGREGIKGTRIQYEFYNSGANEDFFVANYMTDYKSLGAAQGS